ncbi:MAG: pirin family protein [Ekhidna sp.]|uniref:pirin family protein n=1 Tax=Ekhidna sp. TaxID=2608089 RepID=UPI0032EC0F57
MKTIVHKANTRGTADFGWLKSRHTFSFGHYYDPARIQFGMLRVLNDDIVKGGAGFPTHPHNNMEIVSIPLKGALAHKDSTGTEQVIQTGEVQIMSAGSGLTHSEYNASKTDEVNFLQVWILPKEKNIAPRYDQKHFDEAGRKDQIQTVVSPEHKDALWINQDAYFSLLNISDGNTMTYNLNMEGNGVYTFIIDGSLEIGSEPLEKRDAIGIYDTSEFEIKAKGDAQVLFIEIPMN